MFVNRDDLNEFKRLDIIQRKHKFSLSVSHFRSMTLVIIIIFFVLFFSLLIILYDTNRKRKVRINWVCISYEISYFFDLFHLLN